MAEAAVKILLGSYTNGLPHDPKTYIRQITLLLSGYPEMVARRIADPSNGLVARSTFLPSLSEVKKFAEEIVGPTRESMKRLVDETRQIEYLIEDRRYRSSPEEKADAMQRWKETKANMQLVGMGGDDKHVRMKALHQRTQCATGESIRQSMEGQNT